MHPPPPPSLTEPEARQHPERMGFSQRGILQGMQHLAGIAVFIVPFGMAFGVTAVEKGMTVAQAMIMSVLVFSAAAQFASLEFWPSGWPSLALVLATAAVSSRLVIMGAALSPWVNQVQRPQRWGAVMLLTDPSFADGFQAFQQGGRDLGRLLGASLMLWLAWVAGTAIGAIAGERIGHLDRFGIDVLMAAYFTTMILGPLLNTPDVRRAAFAVLPSYGTAAIVAVAGLYLLPPGWNVVAAAVAGGAVEAWRHDR